MTFTRFASMLLAPLVIAIAALLTLTATAASGQDTDATIDLTVRWPDGSLGPSDICANYHAFFGPGDFGFFTATSGPTASLPVTSGGQVAISVGSRCEPGDNTTVAPITFNAGTLSLGDAESHLLTVQPGSNPITITIGSATLSGTLSGTIEPSRCIVSAFGSSDIREAPGPATFSTRPNDDGTWEMPVHPGSYTVETSCFIRSAFEAWPNAAEVASAETIVIANGQTRSGINFELSDRFNESTGMGLILVADEADRNVPFCRELYRADGTLVSHFGFASADNGQYRIRVTDCFERGFVDQWYPDGASAPGGPVFDVDGSVFEVFIDLSPLEFPGRLPQPAPEEPGTCNGLPITIDIAAGDLPTSGDDVILGTDGDDVINAGDGADVICGLGGDDLINAGNGPDTVLGGPGADTIQAGQGKDLVFGQGGDDFISGGKGKDTLIGGSGNDDVRGNEGTDRLDGGPGNDGLRGGQKADNITGGSGDDALIGGTRPDLLDGGSGLDSYNGGGGNNTCIADPTGLVEVRTRCQL